MFRISELTLLRHATRVLAVLSLALTSLLFVRIRSPRTLVLLPPKLLVGPLAPLLGLGASIASGLGIRTRARMASIIGLVNLTIVARHIQRVASPHAGFEQAFGPDWLDQIPRQMVSRLPKRRLTWWLPRGPNPVLDRDVAFWSGPIAGRSLLCDVWYPPETVEQSGVAVVYIHRGNWHYFDKDVGTRTLFRHLVGQGHVVMDVGCRLCPEVDFRGMVADAKHAVIWMKRHAAEYAVKPERIVLMGESSGGHIALLTAYSAGLPALSPNDLMDVDTSVRGVVALAGPADMRACRDHAIRLGSGELISKPGEGPLWRYATNPIMKMFAHRYPNQDWTLTISQQLADVVGGDPDTVPEMYDLASPVAHVNPVCPPTLLIHGEDDSVVPIEATRTLSRQLARAGVPVVSVQLPETDHAFGLAVLPEISPTLQAVLYDLDRFLALMASARDISEGSMRNQAAHALRTPALR